MGGFRVAEGQAVGLILFIRRHSKDFHFTIFFLRSIVLPSTSNLPTPLHGLSVAPCVADHFRAFTPSKMTMFQPLVPCS